MSVIATAVKHLLAAGVTGDDLVRAIAEMEAAAPRIVDTAAERRREKDRVYQAEKRRQSLPISADSADVVADTDAAPFLDKEKSPRPPKEIKPIPCEGSARRAGPFPKPDGVDPEHWRDFLANRKRKALSNTPTAHKRLMDDLARLSDDEWPPGRLIEHAAAHGWAGIYDPRVKDRTNGSDRKGSGKRTGPVDGFGIALAQAAGRET